jgi:uncharacterized protein (TIGR03437 family)
MKAAAQHQAKHSSTYQRSYAFLAVTLTVAGAGILSSGRATEVVRATEGSVREVRAQPIHRSFDRIPLNFEENFGQAEPKVKFLSHGPGYSLLLTSKDVVLSVSKLSQQQAGEKSRSRDQAPREVLKMSLVGANSAAHIEGLEELPGKSHYFIGNDPKKWRTGVTTFSRVKYHSVYPGVDLVFYGNQQHLEYDLLVAPHADPRLIKLSFTGAGSPRVETNGDLVLPTKNGEIRHLKPEVFQEVDGRRRLIEGSYAIRGQHEVAFVLGPYDHNRPLVIDPQLVFSTTGIAANAIAVDEAGNSYLTGSAYPAGPQVDTFVSKLNPSGTALLYRTYLGGSGSDIVVAIAVDTTGQVTVMGETDSSDFPTTPGVHTTYGTGYVNAFVATLNSSGSVVTSTHMIVGGAPMASDRISTVDAYGVDATGNAYVGGFDDQLSPATPGILETSSGYLFVRKLNARGIVYSFRFSHVEPVAFFPDEGGQAVSDIAADSSGNAYVLARTGYDSIFTTPGAFQSRHSPPELLPNGWGTLLKDAFVMKVSPNGSLIYSTYINGTLGSEGAAIEVDSAGNAYIAGRTASTDFPVTDGAFQTTFSGGGFCDASYPIPNLCTTGFVTKLNSSGSGLLFSTFTHFFRIDPRYRDGPSGIAIDNAGDVYLTGGTQSVDFPATPDAIQAKYAGDGDAYIAKLNSSGALLYATYFGGNKFDGGSQIAVDTTGNIYVIGSTQSSDFQTTPGAYAAPTNRSAFAMRIAPDVLSISAAHFNIGPIPRESIVSAFGLNLATSTESAGEFPLPTLLGGSKVMIKDSSGIEVAAPLFYVSPTQINYQVPAGTVLGPAVVRVTSGAGRVFTGLMLISEVAPALFTLNQAGSGAAAALDAFNFAGGPFAAIRSDGQPNIISFFGTGLGADATGEDGIDVSSSVETTIDGLAATTAFAGSAPGFVGLNQINVVLPIGLSPGSHTVAISRNGVRSNFVTITTK